MLNFRIYAPDQFLPGIKKAFLSGHVILALILFCFIFVSCVIDIRFMIAPPLFYVGHSLHVGTIGEEMYRVTIMSIVIEFEGK